MSATAGTNYPGSVVLLFSGKRKSGKDHLTEWLLKYLNEKSGNATSEETEQSIEKKNQNCDKPCGAVILRLSGPLKKCYAEDNNLDYDALMSAGKYKEQHRLDMIKWSEEIR